MKQLLLTAILMIGSSAFADGFDCYSYEGDLKVRVVNHTDPNVGTRVGAFMIVSDLSVSKGLKTIAVLSREAGTLSSDGAVWIGDVSKAEGLKKGRNVGGTKLGLVETLTLSVDHAYSDPIEDEAETTGRLIVKKVNQDVNVIEMGCYRYLKN